MGPVTSRRAVYLAGTCRSVGKGGLRATSYQIYLEISVDAASVRIISARPATKHEQRQYEAEL